MDSSESVKAVSSAPEVEQPSPKKSLPKIVIFVLVVVSVFVLLIAGLATTAFAVAYGKIKLNNPSIEVPIAHIVQSIPFAPKTPRYLLESSILAHQKVKKFAMDVSMVVDSPDFKTYLDSTNIDLVMKGAFDYANEKDPKGKLLIDYGKDYSFEVIGQGTKGYMKINKVPKSVLQSILGITVTDKTMAVFDNWISIDEQTAPVSGARLEMQKKADDKATMTSQQLFTSIVSDENFMKKVVMTQETVDGQKTYRLRLDLTPENIDYLEARVQQVNGNFIQDYKKEKFSNYVSDATFDLWVSQTDYYVRKASLVFKLLPSALNKQTTGVLGTNTFTSAQTPAQMSPISVGIVIKLSDYGKDFDLKMPAKSMTATQFSRALATANLTPYQINRLNAYWEEMEAP